MLLSLLVGANPLVCKHGPAVRLSSGRWRFECDGLKDSSLHMAQISLDPESINVLHEHEFVLEKPTIVQLQFTGRGKEKSITINVRKVA